MILIGPAQDDDSLTYAEFTFVVTRWPESDKDLRGESAERDALERLRNTNA